MTLGYQKRNWSVFKHGGKVQAGALHTNVFCIFTFVCVLVYVVPKYSQPGRMLNFIEIYCQIYKKLSLSFNPNLLSGNFKVL